jgi:hypothetical protein
MKERKPIEEDPGPDHTIMGPRGGVLYLREKTHISNFLSLYSKERHPPTVSETLNGSPFFRAYVDLDFKSPPGNGEMSADFKVRLVNICTRAMRRFYEPFEEDMRRREGYAGASLTFQAVCATRPTKFKAPSTTATTTPAEEAGGGGGGGGCVASDGMHIIWPRVILSTSEMLYIVAAMREAVRREFGERSAEEGFNSWDDVFDEKVYRNGLRMLGCCKSVNCPTCSEVRDKADDELRNVVSTEYTAAFYREMAEHGDRVRAVAVATHESSQAKIEFLNRVLGQHQLMIAGQKPEMSKTLIQELMKRMPSSVGAREGRGGKGSRAAATNKSDCTLCHGRGSIFDNSPYGVEFVISGSGEVDDRETLILKGDLLRALRRCSIRRPENDSCSPPWTVYAGCPPPVSSSGNHDSGNRKRGRGAAAVAAAPSDGSERVYIPSHDPKHEIIRSLVRGYDRRFKDVRLDRIEIGLSPFASRGRVLVGSRRTAGGGGGARADESAAAAAAAVKKEYAFFAYAAGPGSGSCMNLNRAAPHTSTKVYFVITHSCIVQRCMNASCKPDRRSGPCRRWTSSPRVDVPARMSEIIFPRGAFAYSAREIVSTTPGSSSGVNTCLLEAGITQSTMELFGKDASSFQIRMAKLEGEAMTRQKGGEKETLSTRPSFFSQVVLGRSTSDSNWSTSSRKKFSEDASPQTISTTAPALKIRIVSSASRDDRDSSRELNQLRYPRS